jgi:hypothetical protein
MSEKITLTEKRFFEWHEDDVSVTLRNRGESYGGGSEVLVICSTRTPSEPCAPRTISGCSKNK